jgi:flagellar motility protein MotE (MotC chaperone)
MKTERGILVGGVACMALAALVGLSGRAGAASGETSFSRYVPDPAAVLRLCGQEQIGTRQLGEELQRRERSLDERDRTLSAREAELSEAEKRLDARVTELSALRTEVSRQLDRADAEREERIRGIVTMVEKNRPDDISPMVSALDESLAVDVFKRMNKAKAGKLLAALDPTLAARLAARLAAPIEVAGIPDPRAITTAPGAVAAPPVATPGAPPPPAEPAAAGGAG